MMYLKPLYGLGYKSLGEAVVEALNEALVLRRPIGTSVLGKLERKFHCVMCVDLPNSLSESIWRPCLDEQRVIWDQEVC